MASGIDGTLCRTPLLMKNIIMSTMDLSIIIGILVMLALWLGALFNIGDITLSISRLFHWIESQRG
ncbi:TPA: hypothetical protein ACXM6N_000081 [Serratia marcescens]|nr:hypothetical protein [Serratia marcescens]NSM97081.1 hypothetical protein [Serratia marcescens]